MAALASTTCTGGFTVDLPPDRAIELFTPEGEREWVDGWDPRYPAGDGEHGLGTVFVTDGPAGDVVWVVTHVAELERRYARFDHAGIVGAVEVHCRAFGAATEVEVTYRLSAMTADASASVDRFAADYEVFIDGWRGAIEAALSRR